MSRRRALFTEADITRALKAASRAPTPHAVEISPDGTIRIVPFEGKRGEKPNKSESSEKIIL